MTERDLVRLLCIWHTKTPRHREAKWAAQGHRAETRTQVSWPPGQASFPLPHCWELKIQHSKRETASVLSICCLHNVISPQHNRWTKNTYASFSQILFYEIVVACDIDIYYMKRLVFALYPSWSQYRSSLWTNQTIFLSDTTCPVVIKS